MWNSDTIENVQSLFPFISIMGKKKIEDIINNSSIGIYPKGTVILDEGKTCNNLALILDGCIRVYKLSPEGKEITLYRISKGDTCVLIISCIMGSKEYPAIAEVEETATLLIIPAYYFKELFYNNPSCQEFVFKTISQRLTEVMMIVEEIAFKRMDKRLAAFIYDKLKDKVLLETTHEAIASELGTAREVISRVLKDFEQKGIVELSRGKVLVKDRLALKNIFSM